MFTVEDVPGHVSYVLIAISYWLTDMFWLRCTAVVGLCFEIIYFSFAGGDLKTGMAWDTIFILINAYQLYALVKDRLTLRLAPADRELLRSAMPGLNDFQIARLLSAGQFRDLPAGLQLTEENEPLSKLYFICSGDVSVAVGNRPVSKLGSGTFIGEIAFLTGKRATATVVANGPVRAIVFDAAQLSGLFKNESEVAGIVYQLLGRELAHKMRTSNSTLSAVTAIEA